MLIRFFRWIFLLLLAIAPLVVGIRTKLLQDLSPGDLLSPEALVPWPQIIYPALAFTVLVGFTSWFTFFVPARTAVRDWPRPARLSAMSILALLTTILLWIGVLLAHLTVIGAYLYHPQVGPPRVASWVYVVGWVWTAAIILAVLYWADYLHHPRPTPT